MAADYGQVASVSYCSTNVVENPPRIIHVLGRRANREHVSICGQYSYQGVHGGYPAYQNRAGYAIHFLGGRWVIDKNKGGIRDSNMAVAYTETNATSHPGFPELIWHVWKPAVQTFEQDSEFVVVDAPDHVTFVGRRPELVNSFVNGNFSLVGVVQGRAAYRHEVQDIIIRFDALDGRWKLGESQNEDKYYAWAEDQNLRHPGDPGLQWYFWEPDKRDFIADVNAGSVVSPDVVHLFGRNSQADRLNGTYNLTGLYCCRPMYTKLGTSVVIRYSQSNDCWLVESDGPSKPSVLSRMYQALAGNSEKASDCCIAYAPANGTEHPGNCQLQWYIWDRSCGQHNPEATVMSTSAPMSIEVSGRDGSRENCDINGEYNFIGAVFGFPAYQQVGTQISIYRSKHGDRWIVDRQGVRDSDVCCAYADGVDADHPGDVACWYVFESSRAMFLSDPNMVVVASTSPQPLAIEDTVPAAMKRRFEQDQQMVVESMQHPAKVARVGDRIGHPSWFRAFGA